MKTDFHVGMAFVLPEEGGYSDTPGDNGGATCMGIEQPEYDTYRASIDKPAQSVRLITTEDAEAIYYPKYWVPVHGDYLPAALAVAMFDAAVNTGVGQAIRFLQGVLSIPLNDTWDNATSQAYQRYTEIHQEVSGLVNGIIERRRNFYAALAVANTHDKQFLNGWNNREDALIKYVAPLSCNV